ncbi:MAG: D-alanyl-D-alanine carboxypeptidase family protein [Lachnospiraceae bacterium]|jgi:D-alanyl-D-alanine carboxypeptidase (penicillin-binding protein 5/6)
MARDTEGMMIFQGKFRRTAAAACCLFLAVLSGCSSEKFTLLSPYEERLEAGIKSDTDQLSGAVAGGIAGNICTVSDESQFDSALITSDAAVSFNITQKKTLYAKEYLTERPMASLTKLMTALLVIEDGDLDRDVTMGEEVVITTYDAWLCGFEPGDTMPLRTLLECMLVYSGNDAANACAVAVSGSVDDFVDRMNERAEELGATHTHFMNPNGLDEEGHYSTPYDIYLILNECLKYNEFLSIIPMREVNAEWTRDGETMTQTFTSGNGYLVGTAVPPDGVTVYGGKTGHTANAGYCLATYSLDSEGDEHITVVFGADENQKVYADTNTLLGLSTD